MGRAIADHARGTEFSPQLFNESIPQARTGCAFLSKLNTKILCVYNLRGSVNSKI